MITGSMPFVRGALRLRRWTLITIVGVLALAGTLPRPGLTLAAPAAQDKLLVVVPGTIQSKLGCSGDWQPDCKNTQLTYDAANELYRATFELPAGDYEYKVAIGGSWSENYGLKARRDGPNIPLSVKQPTKVTFLWDPATKYLTDSVNTPITVVMGDIQAKLGCAADNAPDCLRTWMRDVNGEGIYSFTTTRLPKGDYSVTVAFNEDKAQTAGDPVKFTVAADGDEIYFEYNATKKVFKVYPGGKPRGDLSTAKAVWVREDVILWKLGDNADDNTYALHYDPDGAMKLTPDGITGGEKFKLKKLALGINLNEVRAPYLKGYDSLQIASADLGKVPAMLRGQLIVSAVNSKGKLVDASSVQIWGALDSLFQYDGPLGATFRDGKPTVRVWAPTARSVTLHLYDDPTTEKDTALPMRYSANTGVWTANLDADAKGKYYLFEVEVYVRATNKVERNFVTDPYSLNLSMNSTRSQIVDLDDPALMPTGWADVRKPALAAPEDAVIYELHVRDFSIQDQTVPEALRGTFKAFTVADSDGMKHLKALAAAGLTHIHLLPAFDIATINEDKAKQQNPDWATLAKSGPDSEDQQALVNKTRNQDGFNWGYDPYHYTAPEGSYATDPNGPARIIEFRQMVAALNAAGLRVVMDVVYNHTSAAGQDPKSVLDRIVPGYYYRLDLEGNITNSTCCANTATEHRMMEKLMVDSVRTWATEYKVDGFRFDLMGHHMIYNMDAVRTMLDSLTPDKDGVDGKAIYVYGEGWNFGEVADNARGRNATQANMAGTEIGTFNDRLRDGVRGGSPFSDPREQGFATGLFTDPSDYMSKAAPAADQKKTLLDRTSWIQIGLAGNLSTYELTDPTGKTIKGVDLAYNGAPAGYTSDPQENIVYVSAHDNETIFDAVQLKAPANADLAARIRMNNLALDLVMFSQGVPFFHAGDDMLRSKDMDRNSYDSGDWFNVLDFSMKTNGWGRGLPSEGDNKSKWPIMKPLLANPSLAPTTADIQAAAAHFQESLKIRKSSALFRLRTAEDVQNRLTFFNVGPDQIPGVIAMRIVDNGDALLDPNNIQVVVIFNATAKEQTIVEKKFSGLPLTLHPVQAASADPIVRTAKFDPATAAFTIPARTAAVFVQPRK